MEVQIPFNTWSKKRLYSGVKFGTSRNKKYGDKGDTFKAINRTYEILYVKRMSLEHVAYIQYKAEGCVSPEEFIEVWEDIHPEVGFVPKQMVWYHAFAEVSK